MDKTYYGDLGFGSGRSKKGKKNNSIEKPKQPQRGLGVAQLEKIRIQAEMNQYNHVQQLQYSPFQTSIRMDDHHIGTAVVSCSSSSSDLASQSSQSALQHNIMISYGDQTQIREFGFGEYQANSSYAPRRYMGSPHYATPSVTVPQWSINTPEVKSPHTKRWYDRSISLDSISCNIDGSSNDPQDEVDLELRL